MMKKKKCCHRWPLEYELVLYCWRIRIFSTCDTSCSKDFRNEPASSTTPNVTSGKANWTWVCNCRGHQGNEQRHRPVGQPSFDWRDRFVSNVPRKGMIRYDLRWPLQYFWIYFAFRYAVWVFPSKVLLRESPTAMHRRSVKYFSLGKLLIIILTAFSILF